MAAIDIGAAAIDRLYSLWAGWTHIALDNPANAAGIIDTIEVWANSNMIGLRVGTFYLVSGTNYKCRASATIGDVTAGSKQTFSGLSIAVAANDLLGYYSQTGDTECEDTSHAGIRQIAGEYIDPGDVATYTLYEGHAFSIYGTGTTVVAKGRSFGLIIG